MTGLFEAVQLGGAGSMPASFGKGQKRKAKISIQSAHQVNNQGHIPQLLVRHCGEREWVWKMLVWPVTSAASLLRLTSEGQQDSSFVLGVENFGAGRLAVMGSGVESRGGCGLSCWGMREKM